MRPASSHKDVTAPAPWRQAWQGAAWTFPSVLVATPQMAHAPRLPVTQGTTASRTIKSSEMKPSIRNASSGQAAIQILQSIHAAARNDKENWPVSCANWSAPVGQKRAQSPQAEQRWASTFTAPKAVRAVANSPFLFAGNPLSAASRRCRLIGACCGRRADRGAPRWSRLSITGASSSPACAGRRRMNSARRLIAGWAPS